MGRHVNNGIAVMFIIIGMTAHCTSYPIQSTFDLYRVRSFKPEGNVNLNHFAVHETSGNIYIGGLNYLCHLNGTLDQVSVVTSNSSIENNNKILIIAPTIDRLITCGSFNRACQLRNLTDISDVIDRLENVVAPGEYSSVGLVVPGVTLDFYVAQTIIEDTRDASRLLCIHTVSESSFTECSKERRTSTVRIASIASGFESQFTFSFVYGNNFTYFLASQDSSSGESGNQIVPKISRTCHQESDNLETFTELTLECTSGSTAYTIIKAAEVVGDQLFAVFVKNDPPLTDFNPLPESALCIYNMTDLVMAFEEAVDNCACSDIQMMRSNNNYLISAECRKRSVDCDRVDRNNLPCQNEVSPLVLYRYPAGVTPFSAAAVVEDDSSSFSSVQAFIIDNKRGAFIGTEEGKLLKIHFEYGGSAHVYEEILFNSPVRRDTWINQLDESVIILTKNKLMELMIVNCRQYMTCDECNRPSDVGEGDPFCGWCTLEKRCTRLSDCPMADTSTRWLTYTNTQCVAVDSILPSDEHAIENPSHEISLSILQLPELQAGESYKCKFGNGYMSDGTVSENVLKCTTPPPDSIPAISIGEAHVRVDLHVFSTETQINFVTTNFYFYNCSSIKLCTACVTSLWACDWCVYDNRCTHDSSECQNENNSIIYGENNPANPDVTNNTISSEQCPQVVPLSEEILVPADVERNVAFNAKNVPPVDGIKVTKYECVITTENGQEIHRTSAMLIALDETSLINISCANFKYSYPENVNVKERLITLVWNGRKKVDYYQPLTVYKCDVDRADCSRCLSPITSPSVLQCGWCGDTCVVQDDPDCRNSWVQQGGMCGPPNIDSIYPQTGPIEGGTLITISGTDLGQTFSDVASITIAGNHCLLDGLENMYKVGESVSCVTSSSGTEKSGKAVIAVDGKIGSSQDSFIYQNPEIITIDPTIGPEAGGTRVTITGKKLMTGRERKATIGESPCHILSSTGSEESLTCITSHGEKGKMKVELFFDGAKRTLTNSFTYTQNPTVIDINPKTSIQAGGNYITVTGLNLDVVREPRMVSEFGHQRSQEVRHDSCFNITGTSMICRSPSGVLSQRKRRQIINNMPEIIVGFLMDGVDELRTWSESKGVDFTYVANPIYSKFDEMPYVYSGSGPLSIKGSNLDLGSRKDDITVFIGMEKCKVLALSDREVFCQPPDMIPAATNRIGDKTAYPEVTVLHGNLVFTIGSIDYYREFPVSIVVIPVVLVAFVLFCISATLIYRYNKTQRSLQEIKTDLENTQQELQVERSHEYLGLTVGSAESPITSSTYASMNNTNDNPDITNQEYQKKNPRDEAKENPGNSMGQSTSTSGYERSINNINAFMNNTNKNYEETDNEYAKNVHSSETDNDRMLTVTAEYETIGNLHGGTINPLDSSTEEIANGAASQDYVKDAFSIVPEERSLPNDQGGNIFSDHQKSKGVVNNA